MLHLANAPIFKHAGRWASLPCLEFRYGRVCRGVGNDLPHRKFRVWPARPVALTAYDGTLIIVHSLRMLVLCYPEPVVRAAQEKYDYTAKLDVDACLSS